MKRAFYFGIEVWIVLAFTHYTLIAMADNTRHLVESKDLHPSMIAFWGVGKPLEVNVA